MPESRFLGKMALPKLENPLCVLNHDVKNSHVDPNSAQGDFDEEKLVAPLIYSFSGVSSISLW